MHLNSCETVSAIFIKICTPGLMYEFHGVMKCFIHYYSFQYFLDFTLFKEVPTQFEKKGIQLTEL